MNMDDRGLKVTVIGPQAAVNVTLVGSAVFHRSKAQTFGEVWMGPRWGSPNTVRCLDCLGTRTKYTLIKIKNL